MKFVLASMIGLLVAGIDLEEINHSSDLDELDFGRNDVDSTSGEEYLPRRRAKDSKAYGRRRQSKDTKAAKDSKDGRRRLQAKAPKDCKDCRRRLQTKDPKSSKDAKDSKDGRRRWSKDSKFDGRRRFDAKVSKDSKEGGRRRQAKDSKTPKDAKTAKAPKTNDGSTAPEGNPTSPETPAPEVRRIDVDDWTTAVESNVKNFFGF